MASGLTVGGWFATAFLDALVDKASSYALEQFGLQSGLQGDLRRLQSSLLKVRILIGASEDTHLEDAAYILKQLKEAAYDADDLLDEFEYHQLKLKVGAGEDNSANQVSGLLSSALNLANNLFDDLVAEIREIQERLDSTYTELKDVLIDLGNVGRRRAQNDVVRLREETSSLLVEPEVFGRNEERDRVIELLLMSYGGSESSYMSVVSVLPIVGIGGVGKTTLAQLVYQNPKVNAHFQLKVWVSASDPFNVKRLINEVIECLPGEKHSTIKNLNQLQVTLKEKLESKRFLLVLDDVWNEDSRKWKDLLAPLLVGSEGSKILLTTRSRKVAEMKGVDIVGMMRPIFLGGLSVDAYWSFFKKCAFGCQSFEDSQKLEVIGKKIADKLKGLPLAAKTLGALLSSKVDVKHWRNIMDTEIWELQQNENDILPVLKLSYQHLPASLKQCFAYCSLFPKHHEFDKESLVQMWMAQGFLTPQRNKQMEDVGNDYFYELHSMSFFENHPQWSGRYVMNGFLHDLARFVSIDECFAIEDGKSQEIPNTVRHLSICAKNLEPARYMDLCKYLKLRTLIFIHGYGDEPGQGSVLDKMLQQLTKIRVLYLGKHNTEMLPDAIGNLKHLRYLSISYPDNIRLPKSLCNLHNLQVLKLERGCEPFPSGMKHLINMRQLVADADIVSRITEIGRLTSLQNLTLFKVVNASGKTIKELKHMSQLQGQLTITNLENVNSKEEAIQAKLNEKRYLNSLCLQWASNRDSSPGTTEHDADILEGLQPNSDLAKLEIRSYCGETSPSWLENPMLLDLEYMVLKDCRNWKQLPPLGKLPFLKVLKIAGLHALRHSDNIFKVGPENQGLPSLEYLELEDMPEWEEWNRAQGSHLFPRLRKVYIKSCPKLRTIPYIGQLSSLKYLHIISMHGVKQIGEEFYSPSEFKGFPLLEELLLKGMPKWEKWSGVVANEQLFPRLRLLCIVDCPKLRELPCLPLLLEKLVLQNVGLDELATSLNASDVLMNHRSSYQDNSSRHTSVNIRDCPNLTSLERWLLQDQLPYIKKIVINNCGDLSCIPLGSFKDLVFLQHLEIQECPKITSKMQAEQNVFILPPSLKVLVLCSCGDLDISLPNCLQNLTSLSKLELTSYQHIWSLPSEILCHLTTLEDLSLKECAELRSIGKLQYLTSLKSLTILKCPRLSASLLPIEEAVREGLPSVLALWIDDTSLLTLRHIKARLSSLQQLGICSSLQHSLFHDEHEWEWLRNLESLEVLRFIDCANLQSLQHPLIDDDNATPVELFQYGKFSTS